MKINKTPQPGTGTDRVPFYIGTQRPILKHDTPRSPHREHMEGAQDLVQQERGQIRVANGLAQLAGNTTGEHREQQVNQFREALETGDPKNLRSVAENLAEIAGNTTREHREEQIQDFQRYLAEEWTLPGPEEEARNRFQSEGQDPAGSGVEGETPRTAPRGQTTLSNMFGQLGKRAIGEQTPILEKHEDRRGSTEHHRGRRGSGDPSGQGRRSSEEVVDEMRRQGEVTIPGQEGHSFTFRMNDDNSVDVEIHNPDGSSDVSRQASLADALGQKGFNLRDVEQELDQHRERMGMPQRGDPDYPAFEQERGERMQVDRALSNEEP